MIRRPRATKRNESLFPYTTLCRSGSSRSSVCSSPGRLAAEGVARVLGPVHVALAVVDLDHGDAALDRADVHAEIAADAFGVDHLVALRAVVLDGGNGLVRGVLAGDVAEAALDAAVLVYPGDDLVVHVIGRA